MHRFKELCQCGNMKELYTQLRYAPKLQENKALDTQLSKLNGSSDITEGQRKEIHSFVNKCVTQEISLRRIAKYVNYLIVFAIYLKKTFKESTKEDLERLVNQIIVLDGYSKIKSRNIPISLSTKRDLKITLKKLYRVMEGDNEICPKKIRWLKIGDIKPNLVKAKKMLEPQEVTRMIEVADSLLWTTWLTVAWESALRVGEQLSIRMHSIHFNDDNEVMITVSGKTGERTLPLYESYHCLKHWYESHPFRHDQDALLFIDPKTGKGLSYSQVNMNIKKLAVLATVPPKKAYQHNIRACRATLLSDYMTESELQQFLGHAHGSRTVRYYVQRSGKQLRNTMRRVHGMPVDNGNGSMNGTQPTVSMECPNCSVTLPMNTKPENCPNCRVAKFNKLKYVENTIAEKMLDKGPLREMITEIVKECLDEWKHSQKSA